MSLFIRNQRPNGIGSGPPAGGPVCAREVYPRMPGSGKKTRGDEELAGNDEPARRKVGSDRETLAATAFAFHVRITEAEGLIEPLLHEVDLRAIDEAEALAIDDDFHALLVEHDVVLVHIVSIIDDVCEARAAGFFDADSQADAVAAAIQESANSFSSCVGQ
jgi:hypothetical protein